MVGRPAPKYKGYDPQDEEEDPRKKKKKEIEERGTAFAVNPVDPDKEIAREKAVIARGKEIRAIDKEAKQISREIAYPRATVTKERLSTAGHGILGFASEMAREGIRSTRRRSVRKGGVRRRRTMAVPTAYHPVSSDISLSKAIALNNWSGAGSGISDRDFFGDSDDHQELLNSNNEIIIDAHQKYFGSSKKQSDLVGQPRQKIDLISSTNITMDLLGDGVNKKKKKEVQYY